MDNDGLVGVDVEGSQGTHVTDTKPPLWVALARLARLAKLGRVMVASPGYALTTTVACAEVRASLTGVAIDHAAYAYLDELVNDGGASEAEQLSIMWAEVAVDLMRSKK